MEKQRIVLSDGRKEFDQYISKLSIIQRRLHDLKQNFDNAVGNEQDFSQDWYRKLLQGSGIAQIKSIHSKAVDEAHPAEKQNRQLYYNDLLNDLERSIYEFKRLAEDDRSQMAIWPEKFRFPEFWPVDSDGSFIIDHQNGHLEFELIGTDEISLEILSEYEKAKASFYRIKSLLDKKGVSKSIMTIKNTLNIDLINDSLHYDAEEIYRSINR